MIKNKKNQGKATTEQHFHFGKTKAVMQVSHSDQERSKGSLYVYTEEIVQHTCWHAINMVVTLYTFIIIAFKNKLILISKLIYMQMHFYSNTFLSVRLGWGYIFWLQYILFLDMKGQRDLPEGEWVWFYVYDDRCCCWLYNSNRELDLSILFSRFIGISSSWW